MKNFHKLQIWQRSHQFALKIYKISELFPTRESFGLTSQIQRAATSIPINIAEGCGRGSESDFARFLQIAIGSASEVEEELLLAKDLKYISEKDFEDLEQEIKEIRSMITSYRLKIIQ